MDGKPMTANPWLRIDAWLRVHSPRTVAELAPPLSEAGAAAFAQAVGSALPPSLVEAYRAHDGAVRESSAILSAVRTPQDGTWARSMWWLSAQDAVNNLRFMQGLSGGWPELLLPIGADGGGNLLVVDLESGAVSTWDHENGDMGELAADLRVWMTQLADDMEAGLIVPRDENEDGEEDEDNTGLTLLAAPRPPPLPPPEISADRPAQVLLALLLERQFIALAEDADSEPFINRLTSVLTTKAVALRCAKVIKLLTESELIEEIFASDEQLATLIEDLG